MGEDKNTSTTAHYIITIIILFIIGGEKSFAAHSRFSFDLGELAADFLRRRVVVQVANE